MISDMCFGKAPGYLYIIPAYVPSFGAAPNSQVLQTCAFTGLATTKCAEDTVFETVCVSTHPLAREPNKPNSRNLP